jgi:hypothetical protein
MNPIKHPNCNDILRKPDGMTEEECGDLHIRRAGGYVWSFWTPAARMGRKFWKVWSEWDNLTKDQKAATKISG